MARTVNDAKLDSRTPQKRLEQSCEAHWHVLSKGLAVGCRTGANGGTEAEPHSEPAHCRGLRRCRGRQAARADMLPLSRRTHELTGPVVLATALALTTEVLGIEQRCVACMP
jgi:hypothetical protein